MLELDGLRKTYADGTRALEGVTLSFGAGEIVALVGGSGCGKSTLIRLMAALDRPTAGSISLSGKPLTAPSLRIGVVFQEPRLMAWLSVEDNIGFGLTGLATPERRRRVEEALASIALPGYGQRWPRDLSGGQAQRVALARALVTRPDVLLLDEPFSALDVVTRRALQAQLLAVWAESRPTLIIATHDVEEAVVLADRVIVLRPHPGHVGAILPLDLPRPRRRTGEDVEGAMMRIHAQLEEASSRMPAGAA